MIVIALNVPGFFFLIQIYIYRVVVLELGFPLSRGYQCFIRHRIGLTRCID